MTARPSIRRSPLALGMPIALLTAACGTEPSSHSPAVGSAGGAGSAVVTVTLTNAGCTPDRGSVPAGPVTFRIVNDGGDAVSEVELTQDGRILGEKENLAPGLSGGFTLELTEG